VREEGRHERRRWVGTLSNLVSSTSVSTCSKEHLNDLNTSVTSSSDQRCCALLGAYSVIDK
jgi:hypothetical protein